MKGPAYIRYSPGDMLDGVQFLSPWEELAYRRICDLIYKTGDHLEGDDRKLAKMTKTGRRWRKIKAALIAEEKLFVADDGRISNTRCQQELIKTASFWQSKSDSGHNSAVTGKSLKNLKRGPNGPPNASRTSARDNFYNFCKEVNPPLPPQGGDFDKINGGRKKKMNLADLPPVPEWPSRCRVWAESGFWLDVWGPPPSEKGCYAPAGLVTEARALRNGAEK